MYEDRSKQEPPKKENSQLSKESFRKEKEARPRLGKIYAGEIEAELKKNDGVFDSDGVCMLKACQHIYHKRCIKGWLKNRNSCPFCRKVSLFFYKIFSFSSVSL